MANTSNTPSSIDKIVKSDVPVLLPCDRLNHTSLPFEQRSDYIFTISFIAVRNVLRIRGSFTIPIWFRVLDLVVEPCCGFPRVYHPGVTLSAFRYTKPWLLIAQSYIFSNHHARCRQPRCGAVGSKGFPAVNGVF